MINKKIRAVVIGAAIASSTFFVSFKAHAAEIKGRVVNVSSSLRIRNNASLNGAIVGHLKPNEVVDINGQEGNWYHIKYRDIEGYVSSDYIEKISSNNDGSQDNGGSSQEKQVGQVTNVSTYLRLRQSPSTTSSVIDHLKNGQKVNIEGKSDSWYKVSVNGKVGYLHQDYVKIVSSDNSGSGNVTTPQQPPKPDNSTPIEKKQGTTQNVSTNLRIRDKASTSGLVVGYVYPGQTVDIIGESGDWYNIELNGRKGYVSKSYIKIITPGSSTGGQAPSQPSNPSTGQESTYNKVLEIMKNQIGAPYVYGGSGELLTRELIDSLKIKYPSYAAEGKYDNALKEVGKGYRAFDCSGLMYWSFKQAGINLGRSTYGQIENGVEVSLDNLQPGDLLFYKNLGHVGMYIGNGQWIEAPNHNGCVRIINVPWNSIGRARRVIR